MSVIQEVLSGHKPEVPQLSGEPLKYHYFVHVHIALISTWTGISPVLVLNALWWIPAVVAALAASASLGRLLVQSNQYVGTVAAWFSLLAVPAGYWWEQMRFGHDTPFVYLSPTQIYALPMMFVVTHGVVANIREDSRRRLIWLALVLAGASGAKVTVVPLTLAGIVFAIVGDRLSGGKYRKSLYQLLGVALLVFLLSYLGITGSAGGGFELFSVLSRSREFRELIPGAAGAGKGHLVYPEVRTMVGAVSAAVVITWQVLFRIYAMVGLFALFIAKKRSLPEVWFFAGVGLSAWGVFYAAYHLGVSQLYFVTIALPILIVYSVAVAFRLARESGYDIFKAALVGIFAFTVMEFFLSKRKHTESYGVLEEMVWPALIMAISLLLLEVIRRKSKFFTAAPFLSLAIAFLLGASIPNDLAMYYAYQKTWRGDSKPWVDTKHNRYVSEAELESMIWLNQNSASDAVFVTNAFCQPVESSDVFNCDARAFWQTAVSGRNAVLEGWSYTTQSQALIQTPGFDPKTTEPFPERRAISVAAVEAPTLELLEELRSKYGASYVVVNRRAGRESPDLAEVSELIFDNEAVAIYKF